MKKLIFIVVFGALGILSYSLGGPVTSAEAQAMARCKVTVPQSWGEFVGMSDSYGLAFKDSSGTLRFVRQLPFGLESTPQVAVEVQRN